MVIPHLHIGFTLPLDDVLSEKAAEIDISY